MMKKLIYLFSAVALLCACEQSDVIEQPNQGGTASGDLPEVIYATVADNNDKSDKTRTYVDGKKVLWHGGDNITYFFDFFHGAQYKYNGEDGVAEAEFDKVPGSEGTRDFELSRSYAVYPFEVGASCIQDNGVEKLQVFYPAEQNYMPNSFGRGANVMVAAGKHALDDNLRFRNACGYLVIKLYGENITVKSIELTALGGEKIAGKGLITASNDAVPTVKMTDEGSSTITLNCGSGVTLGADKANATEFWFAMPPTIFEEGFKILVAPTTGMAFEMQTSMRVEITRNDIQPMAALQYTPNAQSAKQLFYTRVDESTDPITFHENVEGKPFDVKITNHYYDDRLGKFIIECDAPITEIRDYAFCKTEISSISLPKQLKTIGAYALATTKLRRLVIPGNVTLIKEGALINNRNMPSITFLWGEEILEIRDEDDIMEGVEDGYGQFSNTPLDTIYVDRNIRYTDDEGGEHAKVGNEHGLFGNRGWVHLTIGPNMSTIIESMFVDCDIKKLVIPGNITSIGKNAFFHNVPLEELVFEPSPTNTPLTFGNSTYLLSDVSPFYLPNSSAGDKLTTIRLNREIIYTCENVNSKDNGLFSDRRKLTTLELGEQVKTISDYMFAASEVLTSVTLPDGLTTIGKHAFADSPQLASVTIPSSVTSIGNSAFEDCEALSTVDVPTSVTTMGNDVFKDCDALKTATLGAQTIGTGVLYDCDKLHTVTIKGTVNTIGKDAFYSCGALKDVTFSPSPTNEGLKLYCQTYGASIQGPFHDAPLVSANWDRTITLHGNSTGVLGLFEGKSALTSVTIGSQVQKIPLNTFKGAGLTSITIPANVSEIECDAFLDCDDLHTVIISPSGNGLALYHQSDDYGPFYDSPLSRIELGRTIRSKHGNQLFSPSEKKAGVFASEESVDEVTVTIGSNVSMVGPYMFNGLNIKSIEIPSSVGEVSHNAFNNCDELTIVTVGAQIVSEGAFYDCDALQTVTIKGTVNTIGNDVFYSCGKIKNVTFEESTTGSTLTIGYQTYGTDEQGPFYDAPLEKVDWRRNISYTLANKGAVDGNDEGLFSGKSTLKTVNIGAQVNSIPPYTFAGAGFTAIWVPREVTSIGDYAFAGSSLQTLTCNHSTPPTLGTGVFEGSSLRSISVVKGSKQAFIDAGWSSYGTIYEWVP